jgi:hypothetical protein
MRDASKRVLLRISFGSIGFFYDIFLRFVWQDKHQFRMRPANWFAQR